MLLSLFAISPFVSLTIYGKSMLPTLKPGQKVLVQKKWFSCRIQVGDSIAVKDPRTAKILVKRITRIEKGKYYILGDNKQESIDSRDFGLIPYSQIIGKVIFVK